MSGQIMPNEPHISWWRRPQFQIEVSWSLLPGPLPFRKWLIDCEGASQRKYLGFRVFWLRGWVRVLGIYAGVGVFWRGNKIEADHDQ